jgi:hypothetical protein
MGRRNIYIRDEDEGVWDQASELAGKEESMSQIIVRGLKNYISSRKGQPMELLTVHLTDREDQESTKKFSGRWLIQRFTSTAGEIYVTIPTSAQGFDINCDYMEWYVAETAKGQLAVWADPQRFGVSGFWVYTDLDQAEGHGIPGDVCSAAATALGIERAELLDI